MKSWLRTMILLGMAIAFRQYVGAQIPLEYGTAFPTQPSRYSWFADTVNHQLWQWVDQWELRVPEATKVAPCHSFMTSESPKGLKIFERNGTIAFQSPIRCHCADSMVVVLTGRAFDVDNLPVKDVRPSKVSFFDYSGRLLRYYEEFLRYVFQIQWKGGLAWCLPEYNPVAGKINIPFGEQLHNWGVFAGNGRWVIPPIYDLPFKFVNGIAEVRYYGRSLKINENGETVE